MERRAPAHPGPQPLRMDASVRANDFMRYLLLFLALASAPLAVAAQQTGPLARDGAAVRYLESKGLTIDARFSVPGGLHGYAATTPNGQRIVFFTSADGKVSIFGTLLDEQGRNLTREYQDSYVQKPLNRKYFSRLEKARWIAAGAKHPKRIVYAFIDPNCPYCHQFWEAARKAYSKGLQVRYIVVGILGSSSVNKAAAILGAKDPAAALEENERGFKHHSGAIAPVTKMPSKLHDEIAEHNRLMSQFGLDGTPGLVWKDDEGKVQTSNGLPPESQLQQIFGLDEQKG